MNEAKYRFSVVRLLGVIGVGAFFSIVIVGGVGQHVLDGPSVLITCGLCFLLLLAAYGSEFIRFVPAALLSLVCRDKMPNPRFAEIAAHGQRFAMASGVIGTVVGCIQMLHGISDPTAVGLGMASALIATLCAVVLSEVFFVTVGISFSDEGRVERAKPSLVGIIWVLGLLELLLFTAMCWVMVWLKATP